MFKFLQYSTMCSIALISASAAMGSDDIELKTASGQAKFLIKETAGDGVYSYILMNEKTTLYNSPFERKTYFVGLSGLRFQNTPLSYGSTNGSLSVRSQDHVSVCSGSGSESSPSNCKHIKNRSPRLSIVGKFVKDELDYFRISVQSVENSSIRTFEAPACGLAVYGGISESTLQTDAEVYDRLEKLKTPLATLALKYPLSLEEEKLASFISLPEDNYVRNGENALRVDSIYSFRDPRNTEKHSYDFIRTEHGIDVFFVARNRSGNRDYAYFIGILPKEVQLSSIQVGSAYGVDPYDPNAVLDQREGFVMITLNGRKYLANRYLNRLKLDNFNVSGTLANIRFAPVARGEDRTIKGQRPTKLDLEDMLSHQCRLQSLVR